MEVTGKIKLITETETIGDNGFRKRDIVVTTDEQYPQHLSIQFVQDKCDLLNAYKAGQDVKIGINLRGREWVSKEGEVKYFNSIQGWNINRVNTPHIPNSESFDAPFIGSDVAGEDDLPF